MPSTATRIRTSKPSAHTVECQVDRQFMALLNAFRNSGGLARAQEVFTMYRSRHGADVATLARWIVRREIISFDWQSKVWVPLFQFDRTAMALQPGLSRVLSVLNPILDPEELAAWFAQPSRWLMEQAPADMLETDPSAVLQAACTVS